MSVELLINVTPQETRVALIENGVLQEVFVERASRRGLVGNVYKGSVQRVLPGMQAAFVDVGLARTAFLHASDISSPPHPDRTGNGAAQGNPKAASEQAPNYANGEGERFGAPTNISDLLREGDEVLVQVVKDPIGTKGARLTTRIAIPSCYLVYMPEGSAVGVSQRIEDENERERLREQIRTLAANGTDVTAGEEAPSNGGYIVRTAAESASNEKLEADMKFLHKIWGAVGERSGNAPVPSVVYEDFPLVIRTMRELVGTEIERVRIDSRETCQRVQEFVRQFSPEMETRIEHYPGERPIFDLYGVEDEIQKALELKAQLKSGGHLVIDQTEAMTTIDVNTGAFVGHRNLEETIFKTNLEATQAIARQLRLRNLGGIIIIDFIDMEDEEHKRQVLRSLEKRLERDHTKTHISEVSSLGLVQMTRKRSRESLEHILCEGCPTCGGRGSVKTAESVGYEIFREILREARQYDAKQLLVLASAEVVDRLIDEESTSFAELEAFIGVPIKLQVESQYVREQYDVVLM